MKLFLQFLTVFVVIYCSLSLLKLLISGKRNKRCLAPEAPGGWPIFGHLHLLVGKEKVLHHTLGQMADKHGPIFFIRLGSQQAVVISSSEIVKECFTTSDKAISSRPNIMSGRHMSYNSADFIFAPYGPFWRKMRRIVKQELLAGRGLKMIKQVFDQELNQWVKRLYDLLNKDERGQPVLVNLQEMLNDLSLAVFAKVVVGKDVNTIHPDETKEWHDTVAKFFHMTGMFVVSDVFPSLRWLDWQVEKEMKKVGKSFDIILQRYLEEHKQKRAARKVQEGDCNQDFMDLMLSLKEEGELGGLPVDEDVNIKATCQGIIVGGTESTPSATVWALSLLLNNQSALEKVREEIDNHIGHHRCVGESDMHKLVYLQAVVKESMRLHPIGPVTVLRHCSEDCTIGGYHVPAGTRVLINLWKIQRQPEIWPNPSVFMPERFMTTNAFDDIKGVRNSRLLPFGGGRRSCPGADFGLYSVYLALARILHAFDFSVPGGHPVDLTESPGLACHKQIPLKVLMSPRPAAKMYC